MPRQVVEFSGSVQKYGRNPLVALIFEKGTGMAEKLVIGKFETMNEEDPQNPKIQLEDATVFLKPHYPTEGESGRYSFPRTQESQRVFPAVWHHGYIGVRQVLEGLESRDDWVKPYAQLIREGMK